MVFSQKIIGINLPVLFPLMQLKYEFSRDVGYFELD